MASRTLYCKVCGEGVAARSDVMREHLESHNAQARKFEAEEVRDIFQTNPLHDLTPD